MLFTLRSISTQFCLPFRHPLSPRQSYFDDREAELIEEVEVKNTQARVTESVRKASPRLSSSAAMVGIIVICVAMLGSTLDEAASSHVHELSTWSLFGIVGMSMILGYLGALTGLIQVAEQEVKRSELVSCVEPFSPRR